MKLRIIINFKSGEQKTWTFDHPAFTIVQNGEFIIYDFEKHHEEAIFKLHDIEDANVYNYD